MKEYFTGELRLSCFNSNCIARDITLFVKNFEGLIADFASRRYYVRPLSNLLLFVISA